MLITFSTRAYADITLFGEVAQQLLHLMGHSGSVPGSLLAEDIPAALAKLRAGLEANRKTSPESLPDKHIQEDNEEEEPPVDLLRRAWPLIQLLEAAEGQGKEVIWREGGH